MGSNEQGVLIASSEFVLKSSPVRRSLEHRLVDDLRSSLTRGGFRDFKIEKRSARILVRALSDTARAASILARVFGVAYAAPVDIIPGKMDDVLRALVACASENLSRGDSFAIRSRHSKVNLLPRREIETRGGAEILHQLADREIVVNLEDPDVLISVDMADDLALIYVNRLPGPGGLPLSSRWKMLAVLDSGPLSILAAYSMMRRGCLVEPFIPTSRNAVEFAKETQLHFAKTLGTLVPRTQYSAHIVNLDNLTKLDGVTGYVLKIAIRRLAERFALRTRFRGIILSDISGKILRISNDHYQLPAFYPLIGLEYEELNSICDLAGISKQSLNSHLSRKDDEVNESRQMNDEYLPEDLNVDKVPLGLGAEADDHVAY